MTRSKGNMNLDSHKKYRLSTHLPIEWNHVVLAHWKHIYVLHYYHFMGVFFEYGPIQHICKEKTYVQMTKIGADLMFHKR